MIATTQTTTTRKGHGVDHSSLNEEDKGRGAELLMCLQKAGSHCAHMIRVPEAPEGTDSYRANQAESLIDRAEQLFGELFGLSDEGIEILREGYSPVTYEEA